MDIFGSASPEKQPARWEPKKRQCNCKNSRCLKLYCECFASGDYCDNCNCQSCYNNIENAAERNAAIEATLERNPNAFRPKIGQSPQKGDGGPQKHSKGCHCKKSQCLKKYCECFQASIPCSDNCKCINCANQPGQAPNSRHLAAMAVKRPATQAGGPPAKRPHVGGVASETVAKMLGIVEVGATPSSTVSFGRAGFAAHMDKLGLQAVAQDLLQAAQQRPRNHVTPQSSTAKQRQQEEQSRASIKSEGDAGGGFAASSSQGAGAGLSTSTSPQPKPTGSANATAVGVGAFAARERAVVDCFVAIVQQAAASCTQSRLLPAQKHPHQRRHQQQRLPLTGASQPHGPASAGGIGSAAGPMAASVAMSAAPAGERGGSEGTGVTATVSVDRLS